MADSSSLRISEVHRRRRESSARLTLERYREWGMRHVVTKDTVTSVFSLLMAFLAVLRSSDAEGGRDRFLLCASFTMLGLAAQVHVCRAHPEWYRANRVPIVAGLRVFVFLGLVVGWSVTKWNLTRRTYVASRLYLGAFSALGWQLSHPLGLVVQSSVLIMIRLLMYASRGLGHLGVRCSPLAICSFGDVVKPGDSPPSSLFVEQDDGGFALDFSYTRRGFAADVLFVIILPSLLEWIKDEHSKSLFLAEEARMHAAPGIVERRTSRSAAAGARRVVQETAAGARPGPIVRAWNWSKRTLPLTEFRDEDIERRYERWSQEKLRRLDLARSVMTVGLSAIWSWRIHESVPFMFRVLKPSIVAFSLVNFTMAYLNAFAPELYGRHRVWIVGAYPSFQFALTLFASYCLHFGNVMTFARHFASKKGEHAMAESVRNVARWLPCDSRHIRALVEVYPEEWKTEWGRWADKYAGSTPLLSLNPMFIGVSWLFHTLGCLVTMRVQLVMRLAVIVALYFVYLGFQNPAAPFQDILPQATCASIFPGRGMAPALRMALIDFRKIIGLGFSLTAVVEVWMRRTFAENLAEVPPRPPSQAEGEERFANARDEAARERGGARNRGRTAEDGAEVGERGGGQAPGARAATASSLATPSGLRRSARRR